MNKFIGKISISCDQKPLYHYLNLVTNFHIYIFLTKYISGCYS